MCSISFCFDRWHLKANFFFCHSGLGLKYSSATRPSIELITSQISTFRSEVATTSRSSMQLIEYTLPALWSYVPTHSFSRPSHSFTVRSQLPVSMPFTIDAYSTHFTAASCVPRLCSMCVFRSYSFTVLSSPPLTVFTESCTRRNR
uniref:Uncharacterized protein n=1 Tax=Anopheles coluzzii TaxID=1518534 RepID=A0A8W7Q2K7_ANOCL